MNPKVRILAYTYIALCGGLLVVGTLLCLGLLFSAPKDGGNALATIGMPFLILSATYFIPGLLGGIGLLKGKPWGRVTIIVLSVLVLLAIPVGTLFGGWGLWVLFRAPDVPPNDEASASRASAIELSLPSLKPLAPLSTEAKPRYGDCCSRWRGWLLRSWLRSGQGTR